MDQFTNHFDVITGENNGNERTTVRGLMKPVIDVLIKLGILKEDLDYHLIRAAMVIIFLFFGYQKWFAYEAQVLRLMEMSQVTTVGGAAEAQARSGAAPWASRCARRFVLSRW
jgi:hypothetical protein